MTKKSIFFFFTINLLWSTSMLLGQDYQIDKNTAPKITITGASTLHDWEVSAKEVMDYPEQINLEATERPFAFKVAVKSMDGGRGSSMNNKIFTALKSETHPFIRYEQTGNFEITISESTTPHELRAKGKVNIAGFEKEISINAVGELTGETLIIKGSKSLKMSDFEIEPPSAMFGQIKCKDEIVVHFEFQYLKK